jgi:hypothetical protein
MKTIQEKITFAFAALLYLLFHLRGGADAGEMLAGTVAQLLITLPYCIGFTFVAARIIQYLHHGKKLRWDRIARIFFTIGIFFGFFFALYEYAGQGQQQAHASSRAAVSFPSADTSLCTRFMRRESMENFAGRDAPHCPACT